MNSRETPASFGWKVYWHTIGGAWKAFGFSKELLVSAIRRPVAAAAIRFMLACDHLFFPGFRRTPLDSPVFLLGHPRSGTTFVHRLLTQTNEFSVFQLWEMIVPSLTLRTLCGPFIKSRIAAGKGTLIPQEAGHHTALDAVEEEEWLFFYSGNTQFISCLTPLAFSDWDFTELVMADAQSPALQRSAMKLLRGCLQRQSYATGKPRVVTKMIYSAMRMRALANEFPDAKFVYLMRSPLETIPSHLSLDRNVINHLFGIKRVPPALLQRYFERRYRHNVAFYRYMEDLIASGAISHDQLLVVPYADLCDHLDDTMNQIIDFAGLACSEELRQLIREQSRSQSSYVRPHKNLDLAEFGLSEEQIVRDLSFVFDKYGFPTGSASRANAESAPAASVGN